MVDLADFVHMDLILNAAYNAEDAAKLLGIAAGYLERREVMPKCLAEHIASAFRATAKVDQDERQIKLATLLRLIAPNRRPKYRPIDIFLFCRDASRFAAQYGMSETQMIASLAYGAKVSKTLARTWWKEWKASNPNAIVAHQRWAENYKAWIAENPES